jgi:hypothetical protein
MWRRFAPVIALFLLAPLIGEYLLGSLPMTMIVILPLMAALYGSGALLIREVARRSGGGWVTIALFAAAYGLIEEGFVTQSLFNPNYLHLRLLDYGYVPALGTGLPWLVFVITIHTVWSIAVPIGLAEALFPARRAEPWLGRFGIAGFALLLLAGAAAIASFTYKSLPFMATPAQFAGVGVLVMGLVAAGLVYPRFRAAVGERPVPPAPLLFALAFVAGSGVMLIEHLGPGLLHWPWQAGVAALIADEAAFVALMVVLTRGRPWNDRQRFALMAGGLMVYTVFGFFTDRALHGGADFAPHVAIVILFLALTALAARQSRARNSP